MKKRINSFIGVLFLLTSVAYADTVVDFGGTIANRTGMKIADVTSLSQSDSLTLWFAAYSPTLEFLIRGGYNFSYNQISDPAIRHIPDVQKFYLKGNIPTTNLGLSRFGYYLGRFQFRDSTGLIVDQNLDGLRFSFFYPQASVEFSTGVSILPNKRSNPVLLSKSDQNDYTDNGTIMGSPRSVGLLQVAFNNVFQQQLTIIAGFQEDLRHLFPSRNISLIPEGQTAINPSAGGLVDMQFGGFGLRGNIYDGLFYSLFGVGESGRTLAYITEADTVAGTYQYVPILSGMGGLGLNMYLPHFLSSAVEVKGIVSTGDDWTDRDSFYEGSTSLTPALFMPVTAKPMSFVFGPSLGNLIAIRASYSLKPLSWIPGTLTDQFQAHIKYDAFLRFIDGPISVRIPNTVSDDMYLGSEVSLTLGFRPFSDLGVSLQTGVFLPNAVSDGPFDTDGSRDARVKIELSGSFSF
ncbi:MAG: hypothetical protein HN368_10700 [Spirochaetales bacterium]|jgi:hypothetical protein|nr:hypothetical protein [Spirochaetales bacterium]